MTTQSKIINNVVNGVAQENCEPGWKTSKRITTEFFEQLPVNGLHPDQFAELAEYVRGRQLEEKHAFSRRELNAIQMRARHYANNIDNPEWKRACQELAWAACVQDAFVARAALPKSNMIQSPSDIDPEKMLSRINVGEFKLEIWNHGMFITWDGENQSNQKWIDFAKLD